MTIAFNWPRFIDFLVPMAPVVMPMKGVSTTTYLQFAETLKNSLTPKNDTMTKVACKGKPVFLAARKIDFLLTVRAATTWFRSC